MKQLLIALSLILAVALASCNGTAKTEEKKENVAVMATETKLIEDFEVLVDKSLELESRVLSGDEEEVVTTEYDETKKEILKFLVDNKKAIDSMSQGGKTQFQALLDKTSLAAQ